MATNGLGAAESCVAEVGTAGKVPMGQGGGAAHDQILPFVTGCSSSGGPGMVASPSAGLEPSLREWARAPPRHSSAALSAQDAMAATSPKMAAAGARAVPAGPSPRLPAFARLFARLVRPPGPVALPRTSAMPPALVTMGHRGAVGPELKSLASSTSG